MKLSLAMFMLAMPLLAATGYLQPSRYGDARYGMHHRNTNSVPPNIEHEVILPSGQYEGITVTAWMRIKPRPGATCHLTTYAFWCGDPVIKTAPDLLAGAGAHGVIGGTNLTDLGGTITVSNFPFSTYTNAHLAGVTNVWKRGVYTIDGWTSNGVTVTLGGTDNVFPAGRVHKNALPGPAASVVISGSGLASIGISLTPCYRFCQEIDGVTDGNIFTSGTVSSGITFCVWRFKIDGANQIYRSDMGSLAAFNELSQVRTNALPLKGVFDSRGIYRIGLIGLPGSPYDYELFDPRVLSWYLSDAELERIHFNGATEIQRRGIPQWR